MGYYRGAPHPGNLEGIQHFEPDNDEHTLYVKTDYCSKDFNELLEAIKEHFGEIDFAELEICAEHIKTRCIGYDRYDPGDYDNFIVIRKKKKESSNERR